MFKKLLIAAFLFATTACSTHHSFMDKAVVGNVDGGSRTVVMFHTHNGMYKPQFSTDCTKVYSPQFQSDNTSTGCFIRPERISNLRPYLNHTDVVVKEVGESRANNPSIESIEPTVQGNPD